MLLNGRHAGGKTFLSNHKAQVFTKYLLLQKVSATLRCQPWEIAPAERVQSVEKIHAKMKLVLKGAHRWPKIFQSVRAQVASLHDASTSTLLAPALGSFTDMGKAHLRGLKILHGARKSSRLSDYSIVESNVQYTAYMVHWHSTVSSFHDRVSMVGLNRNIVAQHAVPTDFPTIFSAALRGD